MGEYFTVLTDYGEAVFAQALVTGIPVKFSAIPSEMAAVRYRCRTRAAQG